MHVECEIELCGISNDVDHLINRRGELLDTLQTLSCSDHELVSNFLVFLIVISS